MMVRYGSPKWTGPLPDGLWTAKACVDGPGASLCALRRFAVGEYVGR